jgi:hypothetical protein
MDMWRSATIRPVRVSVYCNVKQGGRSSKRAESCELRMIASHTNFFARNDLAGSVSVAADNANRGWHKLCKVRIAMAGDATLNSIAAQA